eukprot:15473046-Alexandrium_andersonii.AAC.1
MHSSQPTAINTAEATERSSEKPERPDTSSLRAIQSSGTRTCLSELPLFLMEGLLAFTRNRERSEL